MHCLKCGAEIGTDSQFCPCCAEEVGAAVDFTAPKTKSQAWLSCLFLLVIGLLVTAAYFQLTKEDRDLIVEKQISASGQQPQFIQIEDSLKKEDEPLSLEEKELLSPIENLLRALQEKDIQGAYGESLSKDFLQRTSFEHFKQFVDQYPILTGFSQFDFETPVIRKRQAEGIVILNPGLESTSLNYLLINEGGNWKIWGMKILLPAHGGSINAIMHPRELALAVEKLLSALRENKVGEAYEKLASMQFKKSVDLKTFKEFVAQIPTLSSYTSYEMKDALIENNQSGLVTISFAQDGRWGQVVFGLTLESGEWKIGAIEEVTASQPGLVETAQAQDEGATRLQLELRSQEVMEEDPLEPLEAADAIKSTHNPPSPRLSFKGISIGMEIDAEGFITSSLNEFPPQVDNIYVNVFVENGEPGDNIALAIKYLDTNDQTPPVTLTLNRYGSSTEVFFFGAPSTGWPEGRYEVEAVSSKGGSLQIPFQVKF